MKTISNKQFKEMVGNLKAYHAYSPDFSSVESLMDLKEKYFKDWFAAYLTLFCDMSSLINEGEFSTGCAKHTPFKNFKEGKKYRLLIGDPIILTAEVVGVIDSYLLFKTEGGNYLCALIGWVQEVSYVEILEELEF